MVKSMTGFGRAETERDDYRIVTEMKSVNHRYVEVMVRMPREYMILEDLVKKVITEHVSRGRIDVYITIEKIGLHDRPVQINWERAESWKRAADDLANRLGIATGVSVAQLLQMPDVVSVKESTDIPDTLHHLIRDHVTEAVQYLVGMREDEGTRLVIDVRSKLARLTSLLVDVKKRAPDVVQEYRGRLEKRVRELMDGLASPDESRLLTEVAVFAERCDIEEESVRLESHLAQLETTLTMKEPVGRKLDFIVQEMNREVNTIGSKANDRLLTQFVVEAKSMLEQIREQVQNIE